jgi:hypothetical protein
VWFGRSVSEASSRREGWPSLLSIVDKLRRESIRLSQMQDIAGCRVIVLNIVEQEKFITSLKADFPGASIVDRRDNPSYGYRAVHIIVEISGRPIEIQVRTSLQHLWAEVSEKSSDVLDPAIKHGGGPDRWRVSLTAISDWVAAYEKLEKTLLADYENDALETRLLADYARLSSEQLRQQLPEHIAQKIQSVPDDNAQKMLGELKVRLQAKVARELSDKWNEICDRLKKMISWLEDVKGQEQ